MTARSSRKSRSRFRTTLHALFFAALGAFATLVVAAILVINNKPDLSVWHQVYLDKEFTEKSQVTALQDYHALEDKLFAQLQRDVYGKIAQSERTHFNRYNKGSKSDPGIWPRNWNRTFELAAAAVIRNDSAFAAAYAALDVDDYKLIVAGMGRKLIDRDTAPGAEPEDMLRLNIPALIVPGNDASHATSAARYLQECLPGAQYWDIAVEDQREETVPQRVLEFLDRASAG